MLLLVPHGAQAKGRVALRVITPSGHAGWIKGTTAKTWWHDYNAADTQNGRGCPCSSLDAAASYAEKVTSRWKRWPQPWLLIPASGATMLYYPPSGRQPGYLLTPAVLEKRNERWDDWEVASSQMKTIIHAAIATN